MSATRHPDETTGATSELLIFDGDCGFCTVTARWIEQRISHAEVQPWQALDIAAYGLTEDDVTTAAYWVDASGVTHRGERGIALALQQAGQPWKIVGHLIATPPFSWLARPVYALIAKYRYKMPGATDACKLPQP